MRSPEYDAFGPWIMRVDAPDLVPPLYRDHPLDLERAVLVLKVPRNITRRDATPDMDLYDHLVVVEQDRLELLSRSATGYDVQTIQHAQVTAIDYGADLLDGWLTLFTHGGVDGRPALTLTYNAASEDVVEGLVRTLRRLAVGADDAVKVLGGSGHASGGPLEPTGQAGPLGLHDLGELDVALVTTQHALVRAEPDVRVLGYHPRQRIRSGAGDVAGRLLDLVLPTTLHAAIVCVVGDELHVIRRRAWTTRSKRPENSLGRTVVILPRAGGATVRDDERLDGARVFTVPVGSASIDLVVPAGSSTERALGELLGVSVR